MADSRAERQEQQTHESGVPEIGALIAGKYRVEGQLGSGGMGVVLSARNEALGQRVAIKFLVVGDEQYRVQAAERLLREARAAAALRGEHVVRIYDVGEHGAGAPFIVMEHLEGEDLGKVLARVGKLPISDAAALIAQACRAVAEAHALGIVHRDLKPSNLFVVRHPDGSATIKVVDFGIAKSTRRPIGEITLTNEKTALGSPYYMSPEQVRDSRDVDARTDVWSLGVILYELLAGRPAFQASTFSGVFAAIVADTPPSVSALRPEVPLALEQLLSRCLEREPGRRFQSAEELASALWPFAARDVEFVRLTRDFQGIANPGASPEPSGERTAVPETVPIGSPEATPTPIDTQVSAGVSALVEPGSISGLARSFDSPSPSPLATATQRSPLLGEQQAEHTRRRALTGFVLLSLFGLVVWLVTRSSPSADEARRKMPVVLTPSSSPPAKSAALTNAELPGRLPAAVAASASAMPSASPVASANAARRAAPKKVHAPAAAPAPSAEDSPEIRLTR